MVMLFACLELAISLFNSFRYFKLGVCPIISSEISSSIVSSDSIIILGFFLSVTLPTNIILNVPVDNLLVSALR